MITFAVSEQLEIVSVDVGEGADELGRELRKVPDR